MDKKTVFITGAANGIGEECAKLFVEKGYFVGLYDIDEPALIKLQQELGKENTCMGVCDISDIESVKKAFSEFGSITDNKLNILCVNAGIMVQGKFESFSAERYKSLVNINAFGSTNTILQAFPLLKNTKDSTVVITSSSSGMFGIPKFAGYSATKAYLKSLTESLAAEFEPLNINVVSVMPLFVKTQMMDKIENKHKAYLTPEKIAQVIYTAGTSPNKKRHYLVGKNLKAMELLRRTLPTKTFSGVVKWYLKE
jgi:short-subunit dehydrogenase